MWINECFIPHPAYRTWYQPAYLQGEESLAEYGDSKSRTSFGVQAFRLTALPHAQNIEDSQTEDHG